MAKYISLVNLILDRESVTELIQDDFNTKNLENELFKILDHKYRKKIFADYYELEQKLGGKGASLCKITRIKLPVPPGCTNTTEVCKNYYENNKKLPNTLMTEVKKNIAKIEKKTGKTWNSKSNPLLVSIGPKNLRSLLNFNDTIYLLVSNLSKYLPLVNVTHVLLVSVLFQPFSIKSYSSNLIALSNLLLNLSSKFTIVFLISSLI